MSADDAIKQLKVREYSAGFRDGIITALEQLIDVSAIPDTAAAPQEHVTPEVRKWAQDAIRRAKGIDEDEVERRTR